MLITIVHLLFKLEKEIMAKGNVELWLGELLVIQQKSLHGVIKEGSIVVADPQFEMMGFLDKYIAQVAFFVSFDLLVNL